MVQEKENLQFLFCSQCNGLGFVAGKKCHVCDGHGVIGYLDGHILYWGRHISLSDLMLYKFERLITKIVDILLLVFAGLGILCLLYAIYQVDPTFINYQQILNWDFWLNQSNKYLLVFWLTVLTDMFLIYYLSLAKDNRQLVIAKKYQAESEKSIYPPMPLDWNDVKQLKHKFKIDIAKAFNPESVLIVEKAFELADKYRALEVQPIHYVIASIVVSRSINNIFWRLGVDMDSLADKLGHVLAKTPKSEGLAVFSSNSETILIKAYRQSYLNLQSEVDVTDIFYEAVNADKMIQEVFFDLKITLDKVYNVILWLRIRKILQRQLSQYRASSRLKSKTGIDRAMTAVQTPNLNKYSEDLTLLAKMGYLNLCVGREKEFAEMFRIMEGSSIKAVILVGEPGVGKTAMIEGLAQKMIADDVPQFLQDKRLVSLSISRLLAGASASLAQQRLLICLNEIIMAGNVVLFIDNINELMGVSGGGTEGLDLSEVLVEALSKNLLTLLATSNLYNYSRQIENKGLGNIIKRVEISEPDLNGTIGVLEGKAGFIEGKNNVYFSYDALEQAAKLTDRYISDQFLPYKAITLLEEVAVWKKTSGQDKIVTGNDVAALLSEKIKMPVSEVTEKESEKLLNLENLLHERVVDQEEAVSAVANSLRRARAELRDIKRPIANLLFMGPTGVGKTELAKAMAAVYFGSEDNMIRLDMSEYQEKDSVNRLIGAPAGYGEGLGVLTEAVRKKPFSIVLLDELEKAHPDILNLFLQVMDDGRLTDATGRTVDFTNTIVIATSNAQTAFIQDKVRQGVSIEEIKKELLESELKQYFKPEFINRFDNIIVFKPLGFNEVVQIAGLMLKSVAKSLEAKGINFRASDEAVQELAQIGFDPQYGARPLRRAIQEKVDNALAEYLLKGKIDRRDIAILEKGGAINVQKAEKL